MILAKPYWASIIRNMEKKCLECNGGFTPSLSNVRKGGGKFCSMKCYHKQAEAHKKGKDSPFWMGTKAGYGSIHDAIKSMHGVATKCENLECVYPRKTKNGLLEKPKVFDWALRKGMKYSDRNVKSFIQLCRSCHKKYDYAEGKHVRGHKGFFV